MKKKTVFLTGAAAVSLWRRHRNQKYPLAKGYPLINQFAVPGFFLSPLLLKAANRLLASMKLPAPPQGIDREIQWIHAGTGDKIRLTVYRPEEKREDLPCLVYFHGGGFCLEAAPYLHGHMETYAAKAACMVVLVHYRTSDRRPFPIPFADCWAGLTYVRQHAEALRVDRSRIAVGGDSAGGALAAACALKSRDEGKQDLCFQMLIYPVLDARMKTQSMKIYPDSPLWNARLSEKMWKLYLKNGTFGKRCYASPLETAEYYDLPPAYVEAEQYDCLHDEGIQYGRKLKQAGVAVEIQDVKGTFHGFDVFPKTEITKKMLAARCRALRRAFGK